MNLPRATEQDGSYPRPQLLRSAWCDLAGTWDFAHGNRDQTRSDVVFNARIQVPFPPESAASGIGDTGYHPVVWYRTSFGAEQLHRAGFGPERSRVLLHFGAVDYAADVWLNENYLGHHQGGQSPFSFDITAALLTNAGANTLVVRAVDDPHDVAIPRGKQDWLPEPHAIWYHRTTGIWQPVWLEAVAAQHITELHWEGDPTTAAIDAELTLNRHPEPGTRATVQISYAGAVLAEARVLLLEQTCTIRLPLAGQRNGQHYEQLLWSPEHPRLLDASITVAEGESTVDTVASYLGLRSVAAQGRRFLLNDRPYYLRSVLAQNYWPESLLAAPSARALRREVELIKELGFNAARVHQKVEDPRFLYWADRLGLMLWAETANAYEFSPRAVAALTTEWMSVVRRDRSHPSIVAWVPLNESWGVQHIAHDSRQRAYSRSLAELTRALDGTRPVISNDGWEHTSSDVWTLHDYDADPDRLTERYGTDAAVATLMAGFGPAGRWVSVGQEDRDQPVMLTEFGGVSFIDDEVEGSWGYSSADSTEDFAAQVFGILRAVRSSPALAGFCYTQLTDTGQETNGLLRADRSPKLPIPQLRAAITGQ